MPERVPALPRADRRRLLGRMAGSTLLLWLGPKELAFGAELLAVRVWPANDYTRVTLESDTPLNATFFSIPNPNRLVIDIEGLDLSARLKELVSKVRQDDPYIAGVRIGQNRPKVVRLVVDLKQPIKPQVFGLPPVAAYHHRLVFDLYPSIVADPTLALQAPPQAATTPPGSTAASGPQAAASAASGPAQQRLQVVLEIHNSLKFGSDPNFIILGENLTS